MQNFDHAVQDWAALHPQRTLVPQATQMPQDDNSLQPAGNLSI
jgi:hypothetical protein